LADNPLLPKARLRELRALMHGIRTTDRRRSTAAREALLAAISSPDERMMRRSAH
jgi:hypothetical protein